MAVPKNKAELLGAIEGKYARVRAELATIAPEQARKLDLTGHRKDTMMSVCDLTAYLVGWGELVLKWHRREAAGEAVDLPETGFKWTELGLLAQKFYSDYADQDLPRLLTRLDQVVDEIRELVESKTEAELYGAPWYRKATRGHMIQLNTASPYSNAHARLRFWKNHSKS